MSTEMVKLSQIELDIHIVSHCLLSTDGTISDSLHWMAHHLVTAFETTYGFYEINANNGKHVLTIKENVLVKASIQHFFTLSENLFKSFIYFHITSPNICFKFSSHCYLEPSFNLSIAYIIKIFYDDLITEKKW